MAVNSLAALAGNFLNAFTQSREHKEQREENERYKKAMTELLELQLDQAARQRQARTKVGDLMSPQEIPATPPQFQMPPEGALGEIAITKPAGPMVKPGMSFLELMADPDGRMAALESGMTQQLQQSDQLTAQSELARQLQGSEAGPLAFLQSPEGAALAVRSGMNPSEFLRMQSGGADELLKMLQIQMGGMQLEDTRRKRTEEEQLRTRTRRELEVETRSTVKKAEELAALNDALESTVLETGQPFGEVYRAVIAGGAPVLERLGFDTQQSRETVANFDRFNKLATDFGIGLIDRLKNTGAITDTKFQALQATMAGIGTSPGANRLVIADVLQTALDAADIEEIPIEDRETAEALIKTLKGRGTRPAEPTAIDVPGAAKAVGDAARRVIDFADLPD